jgi:chitin disaccharide deacetylase
LLEMKYLIVNADDFNLTPGVREGIVKAFKLGIVRSTTIMINLPQRENALELLRQNPGLGVGLHCNLTYGAPLLPLKAVSSLVDDNGLFYRKPAVVCAHAAIDEAEAEIDAQISLAFNNGLKLTHLDSHHHLHSYPPFIQLFVKLAKKYKLPLRSINSFMKEECRKSKIPSPDYFTEEFYGEDKVTLENFIQILSSLDEGVTEICCHPAIMDELLLKISSYHYPRARELEILTSEPLITLVKNQEIKLTNYRFFASVI